MATMAASGNSVMVVDDSDETREVIASVLVHKGYQVRCARGGEEALARLEKEPAPDVILLDLMMPGMSGWEFRVAQRQRPHLASIPVVAISADSSAQARAIDVDAYLPKPFEPQHLVDAIDRVLLASERNQLRAQLAESERMRALGLLAAGVAHEVNNPLMVIVGSAELSLLALRTLAGQDSGAGAAQLATLKRSLEDIITSGERIAGVVRGIVTLGRPTDERLVLVDVCEALDTSVRLVANEIHHRARLSCSLHSVPLVSARPSQLVQVFVNILTNAAHAIPEGAASKHQVRIATRESAGRVEIEITDTGDGMTDDVRERIFEPFFTTKPIGHGMGLGLAISHRLIAEFAGTISVTSSPGQGSCFRIDLPAAIVTAPELTQRSGSHSRPRAAKRRRVLIVDDEPQMVGVVSLMLRDEYEVTTCTGGREALELLQTLTFDAVLCDLMMPDCTGMDLHAELLRDHPALAEHMLFMTGGTFTKRASDFLATGPRKPLLKPFSAAQVLERMSELVALPVCQAVPECAAPPNDHSDRAHDKRVPT